MSPAGWLSLADLAARHGGCHEDTARRWATTHNVRRLRLSRTRVYYSAEDVESAEAQCVVVPIARPRPDALAAVRRYQEQRRARG